MFICKPERNVRQTYIMLAVSIILIIGAFTVAAAIPNGIYKSVANLLGVIFIMAFIMLVTRYTLSEFEYSFDNEDFQIIKKIGYRRQTVCCVSLLTARSLITKKEYDSLPNSEKAIIKYTLNQNIVADSYVFLCDFNGKLCKIEFEPNEKFANLLKAKIEEIRSQNDG